MYGKQEQLHRESEVLIRNVFVLQCAAVAPVGHRTFANKAKHKAMRGAIRAGDAGEFGKYGENDNFATIANRAWKFTNGLIYNGY